MELRQLAEMAAMISANSRHLLEGAIPPAIGTIHDFWEQSRKCSQHRLAELERLEASDFADDDSSRQLQSVLDEIFVSAMLTRVWAAVLTASDRHSYRQAAEPVARTVLATCMDVRKRALSLMIDAPMATFETLSQIDHLRRKTERWTDLLLGHLVIKYGLDDFAFNPIRSRDFGRERLSSADSDQRGGAWNLILAGLRLAFPAGILVSSRLADHQKNVVRSILAAFPADAFHADGTFKTVWQARIARSGMLPETATNRISQWRPGDWETVSPKRSRRHNEDGSTAGISFSKLRGRHKENDC